MAGVAYERASRIYPGAQAVRAVDALDLAMPDGEFGDRDVTHLPPKDRDIAMVFQPYALYPHMTVADNMGFALKLRKMSTSDIFARVGEAAAMLDLTRFLDRKPKALSGRTAVQSGREAARGDAGEHRLRGEGETHAFHPETTLRLR